jgi:hypothetical protein
MRTSKKIFQLTAGMVFISLLSPLKAFAFCPLCVAATGILTGFFRWLGVDDTIIGLWLGGFITSSSILLSGYIARKQWKIKPSKITIALISYLATFFILYLDGILVTPYNILFGIPKIIMGLVAGTTIITITPYLNTLLKKANNERNFLSHQKMLVSIVSLLLLSLMIYILIK